MLESDHWCGDTDVPFSFASDLFKGTSESKPHRINRLAGVLSTPKFETRLRKMLRTSESGHWRLRRCLLLVELAVVDVADGDRPPGQGAAKITGEFERHTGVNGIVDRF